MRPVVVVIVFPFSKLLVVEADVVADAVLVQQLIELLVVDTVRAFDLAVEARRSWPDVDVLDVELVQMPMKFGLKLGAVVCLNDVDSKRQAANHLVGKTDGRALRAVVVNLEHPNASAVVDGRELVEPLLRAWDAL